MLGIWNRDLKKALNQTLLVNVQGVRFRIKKLDPFSFMDGSNAISSIFQTYEQKREMSEANMAKVRDHYRDVFLAGVIEPKLVRKQDDDQDAILVDKLFTDWTLANELYSSILSFTYGKKKRLFS
jgi:hypothetical protein